MKKQHPYLSAIRDFVRGHETEIRFIIAGSFNTALGITLFPTLYLVLAPFRFHYLVILTFSAIVGLGIAFLTNKFLVFRTSGNYFKEISRFLAFHLGHFTLSVVAVPTLVELGGISPLVAQPFFVIAIALSGYFWHRHITFKTRNAAVPYPLPYPKRPEHR